MKYFEVILLLLYFEVQCVLSCTSKYYVLPAVQYSGTCYSILVVAAAWTVLLAVLLGAGAGGGVASRTSALAAARRYHHSHSAAYTCTTVL